MVTCKAYSRREIKNYFLETGIKLEICLLLVRIFTAKTQECVRGLLLAGKFTDKAPECDGGSYWLSYF